ncbi:hypothetical protein [Priestia koreensis]|uniref:hypothetical protein n=1 Tax=Priestia koreensis TaxID=284581 RepID=UPI0020424F1E|nr:hypothetical protein [Priestia koreensis]MCM3003475.1 hypothetical protein [Priestia koreensis]
MTLHKKLSFFFLLLLIVTSNWLIYRLDIVSSHPPEMIWGSLFDFMLVIPLLTYFYFIHKRHSLTYIFPVMAAGYFVARFVIIPNDYVHTITSLGYIVIGAEALFLVVEFYIVYKVLRTIPTIISAYRTYYARIPLFSYALKQALKVSLPPNKLIEVFTTEIDMFYHAFFSWKKRPITGDYAYTYHQKTSGIAIYIMLIHAVLIETIGIHYFLHQFSSTLSYILLALNVYTVFFFIGHIQAIRHNPILLNKDEVILTYGLTSHMTIPYDLIEGVALYTSKELPDKQRLKSAFDGRIADFIEEPPHVEIALKKTVRARYLYGMKKEVSVVFLRVDDPQLFLSALNDRIDRN